MMIRVVSLLLYLCLAPFAGALLDGVDRKSSPPACKAGRDQSSCSPSMT